MCVRESRSILDYSDWPKKWREFFKPITKRSNAERKETWITFDAQKSKSLDVVTAVAKWVEIKYSLQF